MNEIKEVRISIGDMFWTIMEKWRLILAAMLICAVAAGGAGYIKSNRAYQAELASIGANTEITEEALIQNMTEDGIENARYTAAAVQRYQEMYERQKEYNSNSILMLENPLSVPTVTLQYYIDNHYRTEYPTIAAVDNIEVIKQTYVSGISDLKLHQKISDEMKEKLTASYYEEVLTVYGTNRGFCVQITHYSERDCKKISKIVKKYIDGIYEDVKAVNGEFDIELLVETYQEAANLDLVAIQQNYMTQLMNIKNAETALKNALTAEEIPYYEYLLAEAEEQAAERLETEQPETELLEQPELTAVPNKPSVSIKYVILGAFLGIVLVAGCAGLLYILDNHLHRSGDLQEMYGVEILGTFTVDRGKKRLFGFVDRFIRRLRRRGEREFSEEENLRMTAASIKMSLKKSGNTRLLLTGCGWSEEVTAFIDNIRKELAKDGITVRCEKDMVYHAECVTKLQDADSVVLVETLGRTTYQEAEKEVSLCHKGELPIIGAIVIRVS